MLEKLEKLNPQSDKTCAKYGHEPEKWRIISVHEVTYTSLPQRLMYHQNELIQIHEV